MYCLFGSISFLSKSEEEAREILKKEYSNINYSKSGYYRMGYFVTTLLVREEKSFATIFYDKVRRKFVYQIKREDYHSKYSYEIVFDIIDFYEIIMHGNTMTAIKGLCKILNISIREIKEFVNMYNSNINFMKNSLKKKVYPNLYELIGEHLPKLIVLLEEGTEKSFMHIKIGEKDCFSSSLSYLADKLGKKKSSLCPIINTFALLGLIEKVPNSERKIKSENTKRNDITYYTIIKYTEEHMAKAENIASIMLKNRVRASQLKYENCKELFGEEISDNIYIAI